MKEESMEDFDLEKEHTPRSESLDSIAEKELSFGTCYLFKKVVNQQIRELQKDIQYK